MYKYKQWGKKQFIFAGVFIELFVLFIVFISAQGFIETQLLKISEKTQATVINIENLSFVKDNIGQDVTYEYYVGNEKYTSTSRMYKIDMNIKEIDIFYSKDKPSRSFVYQILYIPLTCACIATMAIISVLPKRIKECDEQGRK